LTLPTLLVTISVAARLLLSTAQKHCRVYSPAERLYVLEHHVAQKSITAVPEAFSNAYPGKEVTNNTTILMPYISLHVLVKFKVPL
jgi:hypothetical protein